jgi:hypothetical protein
MKSVSLAHRSHATVSNILHVVVRGAGGALSKYKMEKRLSNTSAETAQCKPPSSQASTDIKARLIHEMDAVVLIAPSLPQLMRALRSRFPDEAVYELRDIESDHVPSKALRASAISSLALCSPPFDEEFTQRRATGPRAKSIGRLVLMALLMTALAAAVYHRW